MSRWNSDAPDFEDPDLDIQEPQDAEPQGTDPVAYETLDPSADSEADPWGEAYSAEYLADVAGGDAREERLEELKRRIALGAYKPDADAIAAHMVGRVDLDD